jgi:hypothetical protein
MGGVHDLCEFLSQRLDLFVIQEPYVGQIAVLLEESELLGREPVSIPITRFLRPREDAGHRSMEKGKVLHGGRSLSE